MNKLDYNDVPIEAAEAATKAVNKNDYMLMNIKRYSNHPEDAHLFTVLALKEINTNGNTLFKQYATWLFNSSTGSLNEGHYTADKDGARLDYHRRQYDCISPV